MLRHLGISLERRRSWCVSTDPQFSAKAVDVVGLYLAPPCHAVVLTVDAKPGMQALVPSQGCLRLPNARAMTGFARDFKRHDFNTLLAALETATGRVMGGHFRRKRRDEFVDFLDRLVVAYPAPTLHLILDNLSTRLPGPQHPCADAILRSIFTSPRPTPSWLNQIAVGLSILTPPSPARREFHQRRPTHQSHRLLHRRLQRPRRSLQLDQGSRRTKNHQQVITLT
ncbi:MAG: hypothetical protein J6386_24535 [Candidatus Synoicihabitans palmerolidicus]|nr:hypothetical protein [Candidatus Synoicihabitans palmerolidicus]